jgi:hypothetical protein
VSHSVVYVSPAADDGDDDGDGDDHDDTLPDAYAFGTFALTSRFRWVVGARAEV